MLSLIWFLSIVYNISLNFFSLFNQEFEFIEQFNITKFISLQCRSSFNPNPKLIISFLAYHAHARRWGNEAGFTCPIQFNPSFNFSSWIYTTLEEHPPSSCVGIFSLTISSSNSSAHPSVHRCLYFLATWISAKASNELIGSIRPRMGKQMVCWISLSRTLNIKTQFIYR